MVPIRRFLAITAGLSLTGAIVGAVAGVAAGFLGSLFSSGITAALDPIGYDLAAVAGAMVGAVVAPLYSWLVLRTVPLGRAIAWTAIGTVIGGAGGVLLPAGNPIVTSIAGFMLSGAAVRVYTHVRQGRLPTGESAAQPRLEA
ncbi:MAG: hypothetical protein U0132_08975 [Gemmatimonadaceae bacterium]